QTYQCISAPVQQCINSVVSLMKVAFLSRTPPKLDRLKSAENHQLVLLGNGPSLQSSMSRGIPQESTSFMAVNTFVFSDAFEAFKPRYYVMMDPGLWRADNELTQKTTASLIQKTAWELHLLIPYDARSSALVQQLSQNKHIHIHFLNYVVYKGFRSLGFRLYASNRAMPQAQNVLVAALFLGLNLGYKRVLLFGADHNWHQHLEVNAENVVCVRQVHFYENESEVKLVPFYKAMHVQETFRMDELFHAWAKVFHGYHQVAEYAASRGATILNATPGSFVDAFDRIPEQK
ncbi:MAG: hypothetical protein ACKOZY_03315, partial [Flavobacteriales bacterium]